MDETRLIAEAIAKHIAEYHKKRKKRKKKKAYTPEFEIFWTRFKGRWDSDISDYEKGSKFEAFEEWEKLSLDEQRQAWLFANKVSGKYVPDACRWLKKRRFEK